MKINDIRPILDKMAICQGARESILSRFGKSPSVTKENLLRAVEFRSPRYFLSFCRHWLDWDMSLHQHLIDLDARIRWPDRNSRFAKMGIIWRMRIADNVLVEAVWAYIQEMEKP